MDKDSLTIRLTPKTVCKLLLGVGRNKRKHFIKALKEELIYCGDGRLYELNELLKDSIKEVDKQLDINFKRRDKSVKGN